MNQSLKVFLTHHKNAIVLTVSLGLALLLRFSLRQYESGDYTHYLSPWYDFIVEHGGFAALKFNFSNYTPPYLYLMVVSAALLGGFSKIISIKIIATIFDVVCAFFVYKLVQLKYSVGRLPLLAFLTVLFTPTIFLNSAYWGQCDSIYTSGLVACVYFLCIKKERFALIAFGLACSFKLQAMFLAPFLLMLWAKRMIHWRSFLWIPTVYLLLVLPAWSIGRPIHELLLIYFQQAHEYNRLTMSAPNLYQWISNDFYKIAVPLGFGLTLATIVLLVRRVYKSKVRINRDRMIQLSLLSVLLMPYVLPKMHDRYFFPADVLSIVFGFYFPKYYWVPIAVQVTSLLSYTPILNGKPLVSMYVLSIILGVTIGILVKQFTKTFYLGKKPAPSLHVASGAEPG